MHWSLIRVIWVRELRDLIRDRRTVFMIFCLPILLYPLMGFAALMLALSSLTHASRIGIAGLDHLPQHTVSSARFSPLPAVAWLSLTPGHGIEQAAGAVALDRAFRLDQDYPPLVVQGRFPQAYSTFTVDADLLQVVPLASDDRAALATDVDVILVVPPTFRSRLAAGERPVLDIYYRENDERSRLADQRLHDVLNRWQHQLKEVRFLRRGLPADYDRPLDLQKPQQVGQAPFALLTGELTDMVARLFPFVLVMWTLAGALHPAIDLTAGEKERATLETLLLSPASRGEIVCGKFLAVWVFSAATALWNLFLLGGAAWVSGFWLPFTILRFGALVWSAVLTVLLAAPLSSVSMALGAYARSTKEGQYYLLPLFAVMMPLTFLTLVPGVELNWFYSLVPISGVTLLLQRLIAPKQEWTVWLYFLLVMVSQAVCCVLSLYWAVAQFQREDILFRDSEGVSFSRRLRRWLGRKPA